MAIVMWGFLSHTQTKEVAIEVRLQDYTARLGNFVTTCIETGFSGSPLNPQLINSVDISEPLTGLLSVLLNEDAGREASEDFAPGMFWALSEGLCDQLTAWAQLNQPPGMFAKVLYFFTVLVIDVRKQPLLQHSHFNRALLSLLDITNERTKRGQLFAEAEETVIPLIHAICQRVVCDASLATCFLRKSSTGATEYVLVTVLEHFLNSEKREECVMECVRMIGQVEDEEVVKFIIEESQLLQRVARRLVKYLSNLPKIPPRPLAPKTYELEEVCKYLMRVDSFFVHCLHPALSQVLTNTLLSECFQPYFVPYILYPDVEVRILYTRYLLQIVTEVRSPELLLCIATLLRGGTVLPLRPKGHDRFESISTMVSSRPMVELQVEKKEENIWDAFLENLHSSNSGLKMASLRLLHALLGCNEWRIVQVLVTDTFQGDASMGFANCGYERFLSNFPASLMYGGMKNNSLYYFESVGSILSCSFSAAQDHPCPSFMVKRDSVSSQGRSSLSSEGEAPVLRSRELYGSVKEEACGLIDEGPIMKFLLDEIDNMLANKLEENLLETGVLTSLCRFPVLDLTSATLSFLLFGTSDTPTLMSVLKKVTLTQIDARIQNIASETSNFESALYGARKALGLEIDSSVHADKNYFELLLKQSSTGKRTNTPSKKMRDAHFIEVSASQGVVVYQEFVRELAGCVLAQEQLGKMRNCAHEASL